MNNILSLSAVSKWYGEVVGVQDISFSLDAGITAIVGPNGSGKSTLFRLLTGQLCPNQGTVSLFGVDPWKDRSVLGRVGYAPEGEVPARLDPVRWISGMAVLSGISVTQARDAALAALDQTRLGTADRARPMGTFSNGMRQKAKLAQALAHAPDIVLLDEPFTGVDPVSRLDIAQVLQALGRQGKAVLLSGHNLTEVGRLTDRIALLFRGRLIASGRIQEIRKWIDRFPYKVRIVCDDPRSLARALVARQDLLGLDIVDASTLVVRTHQADSFLASLAGILVASGVSVEQFYPEDEKLEAVFEYLTEGTRARSTR